MENVLFMADSQQLPKTKRILYDWSVVNNGEGTHEEIREGIDTKSLVVNVKAFVFNSNFYMLLLFSRCYVQLFVTPWTAEHQATLSFTISWALLKFMSVESVMLSNIASSVASFSSYLQSFPVSGSFLVSWLFLSSKSQISEAQLQHQSFQWIFRTDFL